MRISDWSSDVCSFDLESEASDTENAGIRQEPELPLHENIAPVPPAPAGVFAFGEEDSQGDAARLRQAADRRLARNARTASLDPADGIALCPRRASSRPSAPPRSWFASRGTGRGNSLGRAPDCSTRRSLP